MAFGFPPSFSTEYSTQIDEAEIVPAFKNIITQLGWKVKAVTEKSITGVTIGSAMSWKENLSIGIVDPNKIRIKSKSSFQIIDYGINVCAEFVRSFIRSLYQYKHVYAVVHTIVYTLVYAVVYTVVHTVVHVMASYDRFIILSYRHPVIIPNR